MRSTPGRPRAWVDFTFSANVALTTDYVWRYASQTDEKGAIQGGFDVAPQYRVVCGHLGVQCRLQTTGTEVPGDPSMELDLYGGFAHEFDMGLGIDIGLINYRYPGADDLDWVEYYGGLSYTVWGVGLSGSVNYTDDVFNSNEEASSTRLPPNTPSIPSIRSPSVATSDTTISTISPREQTTRIRTTTQVTASVPT